MDNVCNHLNTRQVGTDSETKACNYLLKQGFKILARNVRYPEGELDIVARHGKTVVFVEVKSRNNYKFGPPEEGITSTQLRRIAKAASRFIKSERFYGTPARFDVITLTPGKLNHIQDAFQSDLSNLTL